MDKNQFPNTSYFYNCTNQKFPQLNNINPNFFILFNQSNIINFRNYNFNPLYPIDNIKNIQQIANMTNQKIIGEKQTYYNYNCTIEYPLSFQGIHQIIQKAQNNQFIPNYISSIPTSTSEGIDLNKMNESERENVKINESNCPFEINISKQEEKTNSNIGDTIVLKDNDKNNITNNNSETSKEGKKRRKKKNAYEELLKDSLLEHLGEHKTVPKIQKENLILDSKIKLLKNKRKKSNKNKNKKNKKIKEKTENSKKKENKIIIKKNNNILDDLDKSKEKKDLNQKLTKNVYHGDKYIKTNSVDDFMKYNFDFAIDEQYKSKKLITNYNLQHIDLSQINVMYENFNCQNYDKIQQQWSREKFSGNNKELKKALNMIADTFPGRKTYINEEQLTNILKDNNYNIDEFIMKQKLIN